MGERNYDFRLEGKFTDPNQILTVPLILPAGRTVTVGDIAKIERYYDIKTITRVGFPNSPAQSAVTLTVNKNDGAGIFAASKAAKTLIDAELATDKYMDVAVFYGTDQADTIGDDYSELTREALTTLVLVFIVMWLFVGFGDSLFATLVLPLAFFATFLLLNFFGYSLNFLTNFSLVLSFGIAVDTIVVIVQAASAKIRV